MQHDQSTATDLATIQSPETLANLDNEQLGELLLRVGTLEADVAHYQGLMLLEAKERLPHNEWLPWLHRYWLKSVRTAQVYMRTAQIRRGSAYLPAPSLKQAQAAIAKPRKQASNVPVVIDQKPPIEQAPQPGVQAWQPAPPKPGEACALCGHVAPSSPWDTFTEGTEKVGDLTITRSRTKSDIQVDKPIGAVDQDDWQWKRQANPKPAAASKPTKRY